jgi:hypothetical protein
MTAQHTDGATTERGVFEQTCMYSWVFVVCEVHFGDHIAQSMLCALLMVAAVYICYLKVDNCALRRQVYGRNMK